MSILKIEIILFSLPGLPHFMSHIAAVISDEETGKAYAVDRYPPPSPRANPDRLQNLQRCDITKQTLYKEGNLDDFITAYERAFQLNSRDFNTLFKNCSDAVNFTLQYFFSMKKTQYTFNFLKTVIGLPSIATLGILCFLPLPIGINSPKEVFMKARCLAIGGKNKKPKQNNPYHFLASTRSETRTQNEFRETEEETINPIMTTPSSKDTAPTPATLQIDFISLDDEDHKNKWTLQV